MLKTILFDLDGTLLDTEPDFTLILNHLLQQHDQEPVSAAKVRETVSNGARALISLGFGITEDNPNFRFLLKDLLELYEKKIPDTQGRLFEGIAPLLAKITDENCQWGIITNKPKRFTLPLLRALPEFQSCAAIICPEDVKIAKPDPEGLMLACTQTNCLPSEAIYVGDHLRDIQAGINAKMPTIAVEWGYIPSAPPIELWQADKIVSSPSELQNYLFS